MRYHVAASVAGALTGAAFATFLFAPATPTHSATATTTATATTAAATITPDAPSPALAEKSITLVFGGDVMLDRAVRQKRSASSYQIFDETLTTILESADLSILNLEGPVTDQPSISAGAPYLSPESFNFSFEPAALSELIRVGIDALSSGNNHIRDRGFEGVLQTRHHLDTAGIAHFGLLDAESSLSTATTVDDFSVGLIAYNQFIPTVTDARFVELVAELASSTDFTVVMPHWGNEYEFIPTANQANRARSWIDAGADLIVGAHPHVIQPFETYHDRLIAYSLGNLVFDQWFEESVRVGALLSVTVDRSNRTYSASTTCTYLNRDATTSAIVCPPEFVPVTEAVGAY